MLGSFRNRTKGFREAVARPIASLGVNPDFFSFLAVPLSLVAGYFLAEAWFAEAFVFMLLAVSIDFFDGSVARLQKKSTLFGNYLETVIDKVVETILFISAAFLHPLAAICALGFSMLASYAKPRVGLVIITDNRDWPSLGEHSERMLVLLLGLLLSVFSIHFFSIPSLELALWLITAIAAIGTLQRMAFAKKLIEEADRKGTVLPYLSRK